MTYFFKKLICPLLFALLLSALSGCHRKDEPASRSGFYFDTAVTVTIYETKKGEKKEALLDECFSLCQKYENMLSRTVEGSDIFRINHAEGQPTEVSDETAVLIEKALSYSRLTDGVFDCTIAPLSELWNFHAEEPEKPEEQALLNALSHVGYQNVFLEGNTVTLKDPDAALDLGGIAKGYIADCLKDYLRSSGVSCALIDLGGNILTVGGKPDGSAFRIGIRRPFSDSSDPIAVAAVSDCSLVTSGIYERCFEEDGVLHHHLLNPSDGYPFTNGLSSVTILCASSADADALSTSCFGLGLEQGLELVESLDGVEALFLTEDCELHYSSGFPR